MAGYKSKCALCGQEYDVCQYCPTEVKFTPWRKICCSIEHYKLHCVISEYVGGIISKEDAKDYIERSLLKKHFAKVDKIEIQTVYHDIMCE